MEKQTLPNATVSLVLGIFSLVTCICYGVLGLPLGIAAFVVGNKALKVYNENPENYTSSGNANAGKILGIVGIILNLLFILLIVWVITKIGWENLQDQEMMQQKMNELMGQ
ncbi:CCC motif membrane protein [Polaribacter glomeratus]|uniref:DUF4190 domain-containing protein n=1 Tax=Polaribacter glomeratus TaxID=102 RepID=A0A2S7WVY3_9FLAO|nr:CCC motif membrane protein [Polaribacter glomeratus]PQJ81764.1 hypothetical protein BTO16_03900 [Polaribacter glomeratus]TXD66312.1 DUF4190 domain-containing protein [Polaribacter glomeratus]